MANTNDDVIIVGSLSDNEMRKAIDDLVSYVGDQTTLMAGKFTKSIDLMRDAMKDFAVTQKVSVDLMKQAWREMSSSFDAMVAAQSQSTGGSGGGGSHATPDSVKALKEDIAAAEQMRDTLQQWSPQLYAANEQIEKMRNNLNSMLAKGTLKEKMADARKELGDATSMPTKNLGDAQRKLATLEALQQKYKNTTLLSVQQTNRLATAIQTCKDKIDKLTQTKPQKLSDVLGMDENSFDSITKKMSALKKLTWSDDNEKNTIIANYQRLREEQNKLLSSNAKMARSNNYLAQSFGYIRNRIVYALTLGAVTNFTKQIYEVRGQYELLERSLGILIDNMRRGSEIFNELNEMALKSPFTLMELATGAKQLMAYNFAEDEVVETTRRLADISSALGVPMERLVYNLGQIRAQTVLTARDARDFANAGLAIVPMLADLYTKQKKFGDEIVTTSQVYDMMSNKMVSYADVMKVINSITDEGGKFFDFQAKQAETMKVQMNNLTLAWNNMLNEIGKNNQGLLTAPLKGLKLLFENWQMLEKAIRAAIVAMSLYYTRATLVSLINGTLITQGAIRAGYLLAAGFNAAKNALIGLRTVMITNPFGALALAISTAIGYMAIFNDSVNEMTEYNNRFGESGGSVVQDVEALYGSIESLDKESATYKKVVAELNQILGDFNLAQIDEKSNIDEILKSREKNIQLIKEEILERKHLNDLQQGRDTYDDEVKKARERLRSNLSNAITENFFGIGTINEEIAKNAPALTNIISDIIESNIELVANKTGDEYEKGVETIFAKIQERLKNNKALGLSEETINSSWLENNFFRFYKSNIISNVINDLKDAKEANDQYNESVNENYEAEKRAAEQGATFNDRVEQTSDSLLKAANDTDKFYGKINQLIKDYSGQNIIDFLVRVNAEVPTWMAKLNGTELARLSARFAALASQAKKAGKEGLNVNGTYFTTQQLYERAAQYASAVKQKQADTEARKSTTITKEASEALKDYKQSLEAVRVAKNRLKQGTADQTLVTEKEAEAQKKFNAALQKGVSLEDLKKAKDGKQTKTQKDPFGDALQKEIQLINDIQKTYKEYRKVGVDAETAKTAAANEYTKSLQTQNAQLKRFGIKGLTGEQLATMDLREIRDYYQSMLDIASKLKNVKGVEALEKALRGINVEITKLDYKKITDGLNSELGKIKDEYELAIELDANPELGGIFADMMGIDESQLQELPRNFNDVMNKLQSIIDSKLGSGRFDLSRNLSKAALDEWLKLNRQGEAQDDALAKMLNTFREYANKVRIDETKKQINEWNNLLEKYSEYEYKVTQINQQAEREREAARKKNAPQNIIDAINLREQRDLAKLNFEKFQKSPEWVAATGDLAGLTDKALGGLIKRIEEYKKKAKYLDPKQIKNINNALKNLRKQQREGNPFLQIANALDDARTRAELFQPEMDAIISDIIALENEIGNNKPTKEQAKELKNLKDMWKELASQGDVSATQIVEGINSSIAAASQAISMFTDMADAMGGKHMTEAAETIKNVVGILEKAGQGAAIGAQVGGGWGAAIGGVVGGLSGIVTTYADKWSGNADITESVQKSELAVKRLENAYKSLENAMENAYGVAEIGAKRTSIANKELQLAEMKRQLYLEQSRKEKNKDNEKIENLKGQIIDLELEIRNSTNEIVNDLLNITSVGNVAENLVSQMIESFKKGEDYMGKFSESFEDMIDNMIMKAIVSEVIGRRMEEIFAKVKEIAVQRAEQTLVNAKDIFTDISLPNAWVREYEDEFNWRNNHQSDMPLKSLTNTVEDWRNWLTWVLTRADEEGKKVYGDALEKLNDVYGGLITIQPSDVENLRDTANEMKDGIKEDLKSYMDAFGIIFGQDKDKEKLSSLQQGIQGITEDTAGAIEAYMNSVNQQVYLQSDLLTQIRDTIIGFDLDIQVATLGQMLLQLQQSYQVQQSIENILQNVLNPSGRAFSVEIV